MTKLVSCYEEVISLDNLLSAWAEFVKDKRSRPDVQRFERNLMANLISLHEDLQAGVHKYYSYWPFRITDPKPRNIHKANVRDRLLHKAIYRVLYPVFDKTFIFDSYSCRNDKGTHRAFNRLVRSARKVSRSYTKPCFALKCDIRRFFDSIDHKVLMALLRKRITDEKLLGLIESIISSFELTPGKGMPLGNLTSQLFANVYLDPLDQFVKHQLKAKFYIRYADDFVFLSDNPEELLCYLAEVSGFVQSALGLRLHPGKISMRKLRQGIDFVGYVALLHYQLPKRKNVRRMLRRLGRVAKVDSSILKSQCLSYLGYLSHVSSYQIRERFRGIMAM